MFLSILIYKLTEYSIPRTNDTKQLKNECITPLIWYHPHPHKGDTEIISSTQREILNTDTQRATFKWKQLPIDYNKKATKNSCHWINQTPKGRQFKSSQPPKGQRVKEQNHPESDTTQQSKLRHLTAQRAALKLT